MGGTRKSQARVKDDKKEKEGQADDKGERESAMEEATALWPRRLAGWLTGWLAA